MAAAEDSKPLAGNTSFDAQVVFEAQRLSYDAARVIAEKIARRISERTKAKRVIIASTSFLAEISNLTAIKAVLEELTSEYEALASPLAHEKVEEVRLGDSPAALGILPPSSLLSVATATAQSALTLISLFRQDVDYKGVPISIDTLSFEIEFAARVRMHKASEVIVPALAVVGEPASGEGTLRDLLLNVKTARAGAAAVIEAKTPGAPIAGHEAEHTSVEQHHKSSAVGKSAPPAPPAPPATISKKAALALIDQRLSDLENQLAKSDVDGSGLTMLARVFRAEVLMNREPAPTLVHVRVVLAGGNNRAQHSLWSSIFSGDGLSSTGGAVVSWAILSTAGAVEDGGVFSESMSKASPKAPESTPSIR